MAITSNTYTGNGSNRLFSVTFPYLETTDVDVYLNGVLQTAYSFANATTIEFVTAPGNGVTVVLQRTTNKENLNSIFFPGSSIRASDLNENFDQLLYISQENTDVVNNLPVTVTMLRWKKTATAGQTILTGNDDNAISLVYTAGFEQVYLNGAHLTRNADYTASDGATITMSAALLVGDLVEVMAYAPITTTSVPATSVPFTQSGTGAVTRNVDSKLKETVSVKDFGASPSASAATNKTAFEAAVATGLPVFIPSGIYEYSGWNNLDQNNITIFGQGSSNTILKYTGSGNALLVGSAAGFRQGVNLSGFTVEGNTNVTAIIRTRLIARSQWSDINVREANQTTGIGFVFQGCMLNRFDCLTCSQDRQSMTNPPAEAFNIEALAPYGNSSNNTFVNLYAEGAGVFPATPSIGIGIRISGGDQNTFISGSPESCKTWGLLIAANCRYNAFIGVGFENLDATGDFADGGVSTRYINCYASQKVVLQGRSCSIEGGFFERLQIDAGATRNRIKDAVINNWSTGAGGLFDSGTGTEVRDLYDADLAAFVTDRFPRFLMYRATNTAAVTGAGATHTMTWSTLIDDGSNCTGTNFVAPVTGRYQLQTTLSLDGISTAATLVSVRIVTSSRTYLTEKSINPKAGGTQESISLSTIADLDAGHTAYVTIQLSGMAANDAYAIGNASLMWSTFSGSKI